MNVSRETQAAEALAYIRLLEAEQDAEANDEIRAGWADAIQRTQDRIDDDPTRGWYASAWHSDRRPASEAEIRAALAAHPLLRLESLDSEDELLVEVTPEIAHDLIAGGTYEIVSSAPGGSVAFTIEGLDR